MHTKGIVLVIQTPSAWIYSSTAVASKVMQPITMCESNFSYMVPTFPNGNRLVAQIYFRVRMSQDQSPKFKNM